LQRNRQRVLVAVFARIPALWVRLQPSQAHDREPVPK
jgi:hypothetical protein